MLSRERILRVALGIVDREGLDAVSMRRVGEALSVEAMSLYNHVANKGAVLDGIFEMILAELPRETKGRGWKARLRERAHAFRRVLRAHPNAIPLFATRPAVTTVSLGYVEALLAELAEAGLPARDSLSAMHALLAYVVGHTLATHGPRSASETSPDYGGLDAATYPHVRAAAALLTTHDPEREFELGLDAMLGGLGLRAKT